MALLSTDLLTTISLTTFKNGSMYTQIWNMFGQRPNLQLLQKERSLHSGVQEKDEITPKNPWHSGHCPIIETENSKLWRSFCDRQHWQNRKREWKGQLWKQLDTGARRNALLLRIYRCMYRQSMDAKGKAKHGTLNQSKVVILVAYCGSRIKHNPMQLKRQQDNSNNLLHHRHRRTNDHGSLNSHQTQPYQIQPQNIAVSPRVESTGTL